MRKILLSACLILIFSSSCKKNDPKPSTSNSGATTTTTVQKYHYSYDYKVAGDNTTHTSDECLTDAEMATTITIKGAFNVRKWGTC